MILKHDAPVIRGTAEERQFQVERYLKRLCEELNIIDLDVELRFSRIDESLRKLFELIQNMQMESSRKEDGVDGKDGKDGLTPYIKDGYWWIGDENLLVKAEGTDGAPGENGKTPSFKLENGDLKVSYDNDQWSSLGNVQGPPGDTPTDEHLQDLINNTMTNSGYITEDTVKDLIDEAIQNSGDTGGTTGGDNTGSGDNTGTPDDTECEHVDADGDGYCDVCGEPYSKGEESCPYLDEDGDGICDICGESHCGDEGAEESPHHHYDEDYDGFCDICGEPFDDAYNAEEWGLVDEDNSKAEQHDYDDGLTTTILHVDCAYLYYLRDSGVYSYQKADVILTTNDNSEHAFPLIIETDGPQILRIKLTLMRTVIDEAFVENYVRVYRKDGTEIECSGQLDDGALYIFFPDTPTDIVLDGLDDKIRDLSIELV